MPNNMSYSFTITSAADFNADLALVDVGGTDAGTGNTYTFTLSQGFTLDRQLDAINLQGGVAGGSVLNIASTAGSNYTINGNNQFNGLFVYAGTVNVANLNFANTAAQRRRGRRGFRRGERRRRGGSRRRAVRGGHRQHKRLRRGA